MTKFETCHFWAGHCTSEKELSDLFSETYSEDDDTPITRFAAAQNETFYDHDFLEYGFSNSANSIEELVEGYSYSDQWIKPFEEKVASLGLTKVNCFVFIAVDEIDDPKSVKIGGTVSLCYLGTITFKI